MLRRYLKSNQGITMGMVLIMMAVLSILGVATLSLAVSAYRIQISDIGIKSAFYVADSELDQAHGLIGVQIKKAIIAGNQAVNQKVQEEIKAHSTDWLKADGTVDEEYLAHQLTTDAFIQQMQNAYIDNMVNSASDLSDTLTNTSNYKTISGDIPNAISIPGGITPFDESDTTKDMVIPLQYKIKHQTGDQEVIQQVTADFNIKVPTKISGYSTKSDSLLLQDQPLWRTALASYKNIDLSGDFPPSQQGIIVNGDVFAAGTFPSDLKDLTAFGGITAGKSTNNTKVTINGNAYSDANVQANSNSTDLKVAGRVFSDNLVLQKDTTNSKIEVDQDAYTKDDIEINGTAANLLIKGNYNGYSGGEAGSAGHEQSSSIVINSPDINLQNGSKVQVNGDSFLYGTVYINSGDPDYQTGESISVDSNYRAYGYLPSGDENKYVFRKVGNSLMLIDKLNSTQEPLTVFDKASHFYNVSLELVRRNITDFLNTGYGIGNNSSIVLNGNVLSTGSYINKGVIQQSNYDIGEFGAKQRDCQAAVQGNVTNNFGHGTVSANTAGYLLADRVNLDSNLFSERNDSTNLQAVLVTSKNHDIALIGEGGDSSGLPAGTISIDVPSSTGLAGLILTTQQVFIRGKVDFRGSIIAGDNITVDDANDKNFTADETLVKQIIATNSLNDLFITPTKIDPVTSSVIPVNEPALFNFGVSGGVPDPTNNPYNELIKITNWKKL